MSRSDPCSGLQMATMLVGDKSDKGFYWVLYFLKRHVWECGHKLVGLLTMGTLNVCG